MRENLPAIFMAIFSTPYPTLDVEAADDLKRLTNSAAKPCSGLMESGATNH
jgi:hypothetical protein